MATAKRSKMAAKKSVSKAVKATKAARTGGKKKARATKAAKPTTPQPAPEVHTRRNQKGI